MSEFKELYVIEYPKKLYRILILTESLEVNDSIDLMMNKFFDDRGPFEAPPSSLSCMHRLDILNPIIY